MNPPKPVLIIAPEDWTEQIELDAIDAGYFPICGNPTQSTHILPDPNLYKADSTQQGEVMTSTTEHLNSPVRNCRTCAHFQTDRVLGDEWGSCLRHGGWSCKAVTSMEDKCGSDLKHWKAIPPLPPRRSLRQWFYDTFWKIDTNDIP